MFHADLHIHSKFSRACSKDCDIPHLAAGAWRKGITVVGTGDFTHPAWAAELKETLVPAESGLLRLRPDLERDVRLRVPAACNQPVRFMLSVEGSCTSVNLPVGCLTWAFLVRETRWLKYVTSDATRLIMAPWLHR